ncbi:MAG: hypothetical protein USCAAHI_00417 [Beijerinckiaceae bacterium]|jgi:hypothetical protein|nr:MAG: hypothetical protein USCAAHI_00417 [Beijerinckiaceae bacterium]
MAYKQMGPELQKALQVLLEYNHEEERHFLEVAKVQPEPRKDSHLPSDCLAAAMAGRNHQPGWRTRKMN